MSTPQLVVATLWLALTAAACQRADTESPAVDRDPSLASFDDGLRSAPLYQLQDTINALGGRDDLRAIDQRRAIDLAWRNRSPDQLASDPLPDVPPEQRARERELRKAWCEAHVAWSWDNLDPEAQLEPRPEGTHLGWMVLAHSLPLARNQHPFEIPWIRDYFERKAWYTPRQGSLWLSYIDKVQMERLSDEIDEIDDATLLAWRDSLPRPGMSQAEAQLEQRLAERLLSGGSVLEDPR